MLIHPNIDPIAFSIGPLAVRWYGLMYLVGFAAGWWLGLRRIAKGLAPVTRQQFDDLLFMAVLGVILGGRLGYVLFYKPGYYLAHPLEIFAVWQGGMSFHGGLLGVILAMAFAARRHKVGFLRLMDFVAPLCPLGIAAGRLGNFINGELYGRVTDLPWGLVVLGQAAPARPGVGAVSHRLWRVSLHRRVRPGARQLSRLSRVRPDDGPVVVAADDRPWGVAIRAQLGRNELTP